MTDLLPRLTAQLKAKGRTNPEALARDILVARGHLTPQGALTPQGQARQDLGAAGRAKDRAARRSGRTPDQYAYNPRTNRATLRS
jgi:hypothetical protein